MRDYGEKVGIAFQLADDLIDIASEADETGKTPGTDLREGVDTLAVLRSGPWPTRPTPARCPAARAARRRPVDRRRRRLAEALDLLRAHPALARAREETYAVAREAQALLDPLPDSDAKAALQALAIERRRPRRLTRSAPPPRRVVVLVE